MVSPINKDAVEQSNRAKYNSGIVYKTTTVSRPSAVNSAEYFDILHQIKVELAKQNTGDGIVLDLCCATGGHFIDLAGGIRFGVGVDFSRPFLLQANREKMAKNLKSVCFVEGNARQLSFKKEVFDLAYCYSSLYGIPCVDEVILEISRVLKPAGKCVLDFGNLYSLNTLVCNSYTELQEPCHISFRHMKAIIRNAGLQVIKHRAFQILPYWGNRPSWLKPLLHPIWKKILERQIRGRMLDEWISNLPLLKLLAFRHVFICEKQPRSNRPEGKSTI